MRYLINLYSFFLDTYHDRKLLITLSKNEFHRAYLGSYIGSVWALIRPLLFVLVIWFIFSIGFKSGSTDTDVPFILWLMTGISPWFFMSETVSNGAGSILSNKYLLKRIAFRAEVLPLTKILSNLGVHVVFTFLVVIMFLLDPKKLSIYFLQLPYYTLCGMMFLLGVSWVTSALRVFIKDISQIITVFLQLTFWLTPIFWPIKILPEKYRFVMELSPFYYVIGGYRDSLINYVWFWERPSTPYMLLIIFFLLLIGLAFFQKLRPHFMDLKFRILYISANLLL
jgi:ABC-type polysaccharide/polyol phosphate export permease